MAPIRIDSAESGILVERDGQVVRLSGWYNDFVFNQRRSVAGGTISVRDLLLRLQITGADLPLLSPPE